MMAHLSMMVVTMEVHLMVEVNLQCDVEIKVLRALASPNGQGARVVLDSLGWQSGAIPNGSDFRW